MILGLAWTCDGRARLRHPLRLVTFLHYLLLHASLLRVKSLSPLLVLEVRARLLRSLKIGGVLLLVEVFLDPLGDVELLQVEVLGDLDEVHLIGADELDPIR